MDTKDYLKMIYKIHQIHHIVFISLINTTYCILRQDKTNYEII